MCLNFPLEDILHHFPGLLPAKLNRASSPDDTVKMKTQNPDPRKYQITSVMVTLKKFALRVEVKFLCPPKSTMTHFQIAKS